MMKDLKMSFKLQSYGFQAKMQIVFMALFGILGLLIEIGTKGQYFMGGFFIVMSPMYFSQLLYGMGMSQMVASSPYKKRMQTVMPAVGNALFSFVCITVLVLIKYWMMLRYPSDAKSIVFLLVVAGVMNLIFNAYCAIVYKYYAISMIVLLVPIVIFSGASGAAMAVGEGAFGVQYFGEISFATAAIIAYACVIVGALIQYGLSCLIYRKPLSEYAQGMMMRKYLKG